MGKTINMDAIPKMEYSTPRRVLATPMTAAEAGKANLTLTSVPKSKEALGFHVVEPIGNKKLEYWVEEANFTKSHLRTDKYTIGEAMLLLANGAVLRRPFWPPNIFIRYDNETKVGMAGANEVKASAGIVRIGVYEDPIKQGKFDIVLDKWQPLQEDLFAKDFQTVNVDFSKIEFANKEKSS